MRLPEPTEIRHISETVGKVLFPVGTEAFDSMSARLTAQAAGRKWCQRSDPEFPEFRSNCFQSTTSTACRHVIRLPDSLRIVMTYCISRTHSDS
jgi:hypothetical protein